MYVTGTSVDGVVTEVGITITEAELDRVMKGGFFSEALTERLGAKTPLESERGYHLEFVAASPVPGPGERDLGTFDISAMRKSVGKNYIGFDRIRRPDFLEVWAQEPENGFEESSRFTALRITASVAINVSSSALNTF